MSRRRTRGQTRLWTGGIGMAAAAAAMIGAVGAPTARADVIDDLLIQAEGDINDAATLYSGIDASLLPAQQAATIGAEVSDLQNEAGLVSQIQSQQDALPEALQSGSQLVGADNQLATASGDLLSAMNAYVNAADGGDYATGATFSGELTGYFDRLDLVYAEVFQFLPGVLNAEFTTLFDGFPNVEPITVPTDVATSAASASASPDEVLDQAINDFNQGDAVLDTASTADLGTRSADLLSGQENLGPEIAQILPQLGTYQDMLTPADQALLAVVDEQWVTAAQNVLSADQAFVAADQAGQLTGSGPNAADLTVIDADLGILSADFNTAGATLLALFTGGLDTTATDLASSLDPATAIDPSIFADLSRQSGCNF